MSGKMFKVWSVSEKKIVFASDMEELVSSARKKLSLGDDIAVRVYLQDGTEVDDNDILQALEPQTIMYLLREYDKKPWEEIRVIPIEEFNYSQFSGDSSFSSGNSLSAENEKTPFDISKQLLQPWPRNFKLSVASFSTELEECLNSGTLNWRSKSELLGHICREISKYTLKPSVKQREQVAKELVSLYPKLKSNIGEGHHGWALKIYDKMNEEAKRRTVPLKQRSNISKVKNVRLPRRGEINFAPQEIVSQQMVLASRQFLVEEFMKPLQERNYESIAEHMNVTFSNRRLLISQKCLVKDILLEYPMFFSEFCLKHDFQLISGFDLESRFLERLQLCVDKIVEEAVLQKKGKAVIEDILKQNESWDITALRLLPILLGDKSFDSFYQIHPFETDLSEIKVSGPETPHVVALGNIYDKCLCYILVENEDVLSVDGFVKAVMLMFVIYYCCNMQYPLECSRTFKFIQTYILEMTETTKLPSKLITFCQKMP